MSGRKKGSGWKVTIAKTIEEAEAIRPVWEGMQHAQCYPTPNSDIDRYLAVLKSLHGNAQPYVMLFCHQNKPKALVIARIEKHKLECKVGYKVLLNPSLRCLTVVYGGIFEQSDKNVNAVIVEELLSILRRGEANMVWLNSLRRDTHFFHLIRTKPKLLSRSHFLKNDIHRSATIPEDMDIFYKNFSKKHRGNLRRAPRKLEKEFPGQVKIIEYSNENTIKELGKHIAHISSKTYQFGMGHGFVDDFQTRELLERTAKKGYLLAHILFVNDVACAFQLITKYGDICFLEKIGYDPVWKRFSVGKVLFLKVFEDLCEDPSAKCLDFYFGEASYKKQYSDKEWSESSVCIFAPRLYPVLVNIIDSLIRGLSLGAAFVLEKTGFTAKIKRLWRDFVIKTSSKPKNRDGRCS